jgi:hypothetical protein
MINLSKLFLKGARLATRNGPVSHLIPYGPQKTDGGHDSRYNKGPDRTMAQREGDSKRRKSMR